MTGIMAATAQGLCLSGLEHETRVPAGESLRSLESAGPRAHRRVNRRSGTNHISATATKMPYEIQGLTKARPTAAA